MEAVPRMDSFLKPLARLSMAIRYFAGGDPCDICLVHQVCHAEFYRSVWIIVDAIHASNEFDIKFPSDYAMQQQMAAKFSQKSSIGLTNCVGAVDGILIWTNRPSKDDLENLGFGPKKFFCGRKHKFGMNMQAICGPDGKFLSVEIRHPGATSDYLAFATSKINKVLSGRNPNDPSLPFLKGGLTIFGDNAYVNTNYMITPYKNVSSGPKDAFNFFQSQLRINIECAFGILVHRWGILRKPMPINLTVGKITSIVLCLCKLHNFCIGEKDVAAEAETDDNLNIMFSGGIHVNKNQAVEAIQILLDGGNFVSGDHHPYFRRPVGDRGDQPADLMLKMIEREGYARPRPKGTN